MAPSATEVRSNKAWLAVSRFRSLVPTLGAFARALTGNPKTTVKVVKAGAYSDGDTIYLAPPISLGEDVSHERMICNMRDDDLQLLCLGCSQQEDVMYRLFHEMGHIVYGSSIKFAWHTVGTDLLQYAQKAWEEDFPWFSKQMPKLIKDGKQAGNPCETVMQLAYAIHPFLKLFVNVVEDVRVDSATYVARPGIKMMAESQVYGIMSQGMQTYDENGVLVTEWWSERSLDMQLMIGFLHRCFEYYMEHFVSDEANEILEDDILAGYIENSREVKDQFEAYKLSCNILHRLHQLGYCEPPPGPEDSDEDSGEEDSSDDTEDDNSEDDDKDGETPPEESGSSDGGTGDQEGNSADGSGTGEGDADGDSDVPPPRPITRAEFEQLEKLFDCEQVKNDGRPADKRAVEVAVIQSAWFEGPSATIAGVKFHHWKDRLKKSGIRWDDGWEGVSRLESLMPPESVMTKAVTHGRVVFSDNKRTKVVRNKKAGRIAPGKLHRAALGDERLFAKKERPGRKDYFGVVMLDVSGSNASGTIVQLREMAMAQGEFLDRLGVPFEMYAHTALPTPDYYTSDARTLTLDLYPVVGEGERWTKESRERVSKLEACCANLDGHALEFARKRCDAVRATDHFILYSSDGQMPAENYDEELDILQRELKVCQQKGYTVQGVGLGTDSPSKHGLDTVIVNSSADIALVVKQLEKRLT